MLPDIFCLNILDTSQYITSVQQSSIKSIGMNVSGFLTAAKKGSILYVGFPTYPHKEEYIMDTAIREYDARVDSKKRITLRESPYEYYHVEHYTDSSIVLQPRQLV